jgi:hypothetical protein
MFDIGGGHIKDYPNAKRRFPGKTKRHVRISAQMYYGIGKHYWVSMYEEDNPIWDAKEKTWRSCWDDLEKNGHIESAPFMSMVSAQEWIKKIQRKYFPKKTHILDPIALGGLRESDEQKWLGIYKEGD